MADLVLHPAAVRAFAQHLHQEERSQGTQEKYLRDVTRFAQWLDGRPVSREEANAWKGYLIQRHYSQVTINSMVAAVNAFFTFLGWTECRIRYLRIQKQLFRSKEKELTRPEYQRLVQAAQNLGRNRLGLLLETICAAGLRVSEVRYITVEAAKQGQVDIGLKGKIRKILLPAKLCRKLLHYAKKQKIASGEIFLTRSGKSMDRRQIWAEMKAICASANVAASKVFPHNLRHLFARIFYQASRDVAKLADVLGHSSIETTRIYLLSTGEEHSRQLERLMLVT